MKAAGTLLRQVEAALSEVTAAEHALEAALSDLERGLRAEKVTISAVLENAFARVRAARSSLAELREQVDGDG